MKRVVVLAYGKESSNDSTKSTDSDGKPVVWTFVDAAIDAVCEITPRHRYRVIETGPGAFGQWE